LVYGPDEMFGCWDAGQADILEICTFNKNKNVHPAGI